MFSSTTDYKMDAVCYCSSVSVLEFSFIVFWSQTTSCGTTQSQTFSFQLALPWHVFLRHRFLWRFLCPQTAGTDKLIKAQIKLKLEHYLQLHPNTTTDTYCLTDRASPAESCEKQITSTAALSVLTPLIPTGYTCK